MATPVIQFKRGPASGILNALLKAGEPGFTTDRSDFYIGSDGTGTNQRFFGSARYWSREGGSTGTGLNFYGNTSNLTNYLTLRGPATPSGIGTYTLPDVSTIVNGYVLSLSGTTGQLAWVAPTNVSALNNTQLSGITTITGYVDNQADNNITGILTASNAVRFTSTTDNTLGTTNTGAVQISGGAAIAKNLTVGAALSVGGGGVSVLGIQTNFNGTENTLGTTNTGSLQLLGGAGIAKNLTVGAGFNVLGNSTLTGITTLSSSVFSTSGTDNTLGTTNTGAVQISGGAAIAKNLTVGAALSVGNGGFGVLGVTTHYNTVENTFGTTNTGSFQLLGGAGIAKNLTVGAGFNVLGNSTLAGITTLSSTVFATSGTDNTLGTTNTGAVQISGGAAIAKNLTVGAALSVGGGGFGVLGLTTHFSTVENTLGTTNTGSLQLLGGAGIAKNLTVGAALSVGGGGVSVLGIQTNFNGTENTLGTTNTGALQIAGGAAVTKNLTVGAGLSVLGNAFVNGITTVASTVSFTNASPTLTATSTGTLSLFNTNVTRVNAFGAATELLIGNASGIATFAGNVRVTSALRDSNNNAGTAGQFLTVTGAGTGIAWTTITGVQAGSISTATRSLFVDTNVTGDTGTFYPTFASSSTSTVGTGTAIYVDANISINAATNTLTLGGIGGLTAGGNVNANGGTVDTTSGIGTLFSTPTLVGAFAAATNLQLAAATGITTIRNKLTVGGNLEVDGNNIQSSTGANVITLSGSDATFNGAVVVSGNLTVNGTTTQVNTQELQVYDRTITLGVQTGTTPANTTWDLGVMMQYGDAGIARTAGVIWEYANRRFQFAANSDNPTAGISTVNPQLTVSSFAPIEIGALWINDAGGSYAGVSSVISYLGAGQLYTGSPADRYLHNVTIDAGTFS